MINAFNIMKESIQGYINEIEETREKIKDSELKLLEAKEIAHIGNWELNLETLAMTWNPELYKIYEIDMITHKHTLDNYISHSYLDNKILLQK